MTIERSQIIFRPPSAVFQFCAVDHVKNHPRWDPDMELAQVTPGPIGVGSVVKRRHTRFGTVVEGTMTFTAFEPDREVATIIQDGPMEMRSRMAFAPMFDGRGTIVTIEVEIPGMEDKLNPRLIERSLNNMKQLIEAETPE